MIGDVVERLGSNGIKAMLPELLTEPDLDVPTRFPHQTPQRLRVVNTGPGRFNRVLSEFDDSTGRATNILRMDRELVKR
ncbi:MAG: hypothetical protein J4N94_00975 [Chloroflexi bacterium]|nr:hypothetical protein [Chloroflexota bacterium]